MRYSQFPYEVEERAEQARTEVKKARAEHDENLPGLIAAAKSVCHWRDQYDKCRCPGHEYVDCDQGYPNCEGHSYIEFEEHDLDNETPCLIHCKGETIV